LAPSSRPAQLLNKARILLRVLFVVRHLAARHELQADRDHGGLDAARYTELREDVPDVHADRLLADEEALADLAIRAALDDQRQDLAFATR